MKMKDDVPLIVRQMLAREKNRTPPSAVDDFDNFDNDDIEAELAEFESIRYVRALCVKRSLYAFSVV